MLSYDATIQVGDLITTYDKGYWVVTKIDSRPGHRSPMFYYKAALGFVASVYQQSTGYCDATWCKKVTKEHVDEQFNKELAELNLAT